jgi:hypothetical protein
MRYNFKARPPGTTEADMALVDSALRQAARCHSNLANTQYLNFLRVSRHAEHTSNPSNTSTVRFPFRPGQKQQFASTHGARSGRKPGSPQLRSHYMQSRASLTHVTNLTVSN